MSGGASLVEVGVLKQLVVAGEVEVGSLAWGRLEQLVEGVEGVGGLAW